METEENVTEAESKMGSNIPPDELIAGSLDFESYDGTEEEEEEVMLYTNIEGSNNAKGIETMLTYVATNKLKFKANYTFTEVEEPLKRLIPKHKVNVSLDYNLSERSNFNISYQYVDQRKDLFFDGGTFENLPVELASYRLVNAMGNFQMIRNRVGLFASINNVFNVNFTENIGYSTRGRNFKLGITILF
jgi:vitamin B12 transporter